MVEEVFGINPLAFIVILSSVLSLIVSLIYKFLTDQPLMRELKKDLKKHQKEMRSLRSDPHAMAEVQKKAMSVNMRYMKQSFRPMFVTLVPFLLIFYWLRGVYVDAILIPLSFWPGHLGWVGTYILLSMIFTTLFRKLLKVV